MTSVMTSVINIISYIFNKFLIKNYQSFIYLN